jgi:hypothetical protein
MATSSSVERLEEALRRSLQRQGAIARFGTRALVALDFQALIQYAVEEVAMAVDAQYVKIMDIVPLLRTFWCGRGSGGRRELLVTKYSRSTCGRRPGVHT